MRPTDTTWVPDWEPQEEEPSRLGGLRSTDHGDESEAGASEDDPEKVLTEEEFFDSRTSQHQSLAEEVKEAEGREHRQQAVAAAIPGVESGMLDFEDMTGRTGMAMEEVEAAEQARSSDLVTRTISSFVLIGVVVLGVYLGGAWLTGLFVVIMTVALVEFYAAIRSAGYRPVALVGLLGALGAGVGAHLSGLAAAGGVLAAAAVLTLLFYAAAVRKLALENSALTVFGMVWVSLLCYGVVLGLAADGTVLLIWVLLLNSIFDTAAFVVGRAFGGRKLSPSLSANKTVAGLVGGVLTAFALAAILSTLPGLSILGLYEALYLAAVVSVLAPLGDAFESAVKRSVDTKDMSSFIPGHGGILDRIDGLLLVLPGAYSLFSLLDLL